MLGSVRVVMRENKPWFVAKDIAACIEHIDTSAMCKLCRDKDKLVIKVSDESSETQQMFSKSIPTITCLSESGLYRILAKCSLPKCEPFESWVFDEVLPSIRQTGSYSVTTPALPDFTNPTEALR
jgi:anti-repressor protein